MHFIPFVTLLLVVLSLSMTSFFQDYGTLSLVSSQLLAYQNTVKTTRDQTEKDLYTSYLSNTKKEKKRKKEYDRGDKKYRSHRDQRLSENSKLNIALLLKEEHPFLENTLASLIERLYLDAPFFKKAALKEPDLPKRLVNELIASLRGLPPQEEPIDIHLVRFKSPALQEVWYHMLKGSERYNLETKEGIVPLRDLVIVHPDETRRGICTQKAPTVLLKAAFGEEFAERVRSEEERKFYEAPQKQSPLSPKEFEALLLEFHLPTYEKYLEGRHKKTLEKTTRGKDPVTGIPVKLVAQKHPVEKKPKEAPNPASISPEK